MGTKVHDVIMIGGGQTSLSAAVYTAREDLDTVIIEKAVVGGMAAITDQDRQLPGFCGRRGWCGASRPVAKTS